MFYLTKSCLRMLFVTKVCVVMLHVMFNVVHDYVEQVCVCVWNFLTEVKPLLLLLFQLSDFSRGHRCHPGSCANEDGQKSQ